MFDSINKVLLITDLDGTLLPHSKILSEVDLCAIKELQEKGGLFSIATGRHFHAVSYYLEQLKVNAPIILFNGAAVYDTEKSSYIHTEYISPVCRALIQEVLELRPDVCAEISTMESLYTLQLNDMEKHHISITKTNPIHCDDINQIPDGWLNALFAVQPENMQDLINLIEQKKSCEMFFVKSCRIFYEILPKDTSKGTALKHLKSICGLEDYTIVAVGDFNNDIEMLEFADVGIAPSNASDDVKRIADIVLDKSCDEGAIAEAIKYIFSKLDIK